MVNIGGKEATYHLWERNHGHTCKLTFSAGSQAEVQKHAAFMKDPTTTERTALVVSRVLCLKWGGPLPAVICL